MQVNTLTHMEFEPAPVQIGEPFRCWECGSPDQGGMLLIVDHSPLEAYADHVYYMRLACGHNPRCVRLGDAIAPLRPLDRSIDENLASVREGLAHVAKAVPPDQQNQELVSKIVYLLVAKPGKFRYHLASILALQFLDQKRLIVSLPVAQLLCLVTALCQAVHPPAQARF